MERNSFKIWSLALIGAVFFHGALAYYIASPSPIEPYKVGQKGTIIELSFEGASRGGKRQKGNVKKTIPVVKKNRFPYLKPQEILRKPLPLRK